MTEKPHILFLFSDTGGGHRSASEAIIEAIQLEYGDSVSTEMVDIFLEYAPRPLNHLPTLYPKMMQVPQAWKFGYHLSNGDRRSRLITASVWPYVRPSVRRIASHRPCDLVVSVHPLANELFVRALGPNRPRFITVVTDMVTAHAFWYHPGVDLCLTPTEAARQRALRWGLHPDKVKVVGQPVADRFCHPAEDPSIIKERFGWTQNRPIVLLVGGGEGMGPLDKLPL